MGHIETLKESQFRNEKQNKPMSFSDQLISLVSILNQ